MIPPSIRPAWRIRLLMVLLALMTLLGLVTSPARATMLGSTAMPQGIAEASASVTDPIAPQRLRQARIEQSFSIRITPGGPAMPPDVLITLEQDSVPPRYVARKIGKCLPWGGIVAMRGGEGHNLLLFMRDQHIVSAELEKFCQARDFYSGFLFARTSDGQICVGRDVLLARNGTSCRLHRLHALIELPPGR